MDREAVKEQRRVLRRIQDHLYSAHSNLGVARETIGLVDVLHHPASTLSSLNYVTPRRNTAWVSGDMIKQGLEHMKKLGRDPRVHYIEGLFPPLFAKTMRELGLQAEWELPLMAYLKDGFNQKPTPPINVGSLPEQVTIERVTDQRGVQLWWYVWRNAFYDVISLGVEPLFAGRDMVALKSGEQIDILLYRAGFPVGVARVSIQETVGHILALALMKEARTPELTRILQATAVAAALEKGCNLVYAPGETEADRQLARDLGFLDFGSIVGYATSPLKPHEEPDDHILGQPVLALR